MMTVRTWSLCSDLDGVGTAMITSRVMSVPSSAHPRRVANPSRSPRQADFADPLGVRRDGLLASTPRHVLDRVDVRAVLLLLLWRQVLKRDDGGMRWIVHD